MKSYSEYKSSGVEWLGEVPGHWEVWRLKNWVGINESVLPETTDPAFPFQYLEIGAVGTGMLVHGPATITFGGAPSRARRIVKKGDTIVSMVRTYLKAVWFADDVKENLICSTGFAVLTPQNSTSPKFVSYLARSNPITDRITAESVGIAYPAIAENRLGLLHVPVPPKSEQIAIVRYLDYIDQRIQRYIAAKRKLIGLLEEERQAIVNRAVTRGLNPDVRLKPSGVEWLGDVPEHWEIKRLSNSVESKINGVWGEEPDGINDLFCIRVADFDRKKRGIKTDKLTLRSIKPNERCRRILNKGDLLIEKSGGGEQQPVGVVMLYDHDFEAVCSNFVGKITVRRGYDPMYLTYLHATLYSFGVNRRSIKQTTGIQNIDIFKYFSEPVAIPPIEEQISIGEYLKNETNKFGVAIAHTRRQIALLDEYRTHLIADVVTGKLDVREAAAQLPSSTKGVPIMPNGDI